jgi:hypothetical protein
MTAKYLPEGCELLCLDSADWGNVADWVSGLGSFAAVGVALWISGSQNRAAAKLRVVEANEAHERRARVVGEAIRLASEIEARATAYYRSTGSSGSGILPDRNYGVQKGLLDEIAGLRSQVEALQHFPMTDVRVFTEIGRMFHDSDIDVEPLELAVVTAMKINNVANKMKLRREAIANLR